MLLVHADERGERQAVRKARFQTQSLQPYFPLCFPTVCYVKATHEKARRENKKESTVHPFLKVSTEGEKSCCNTMGGPETHLKIRKETEPLQESANTPIARAI